MRETALHRSIALVPSAPPQAREAIALHSVSPAEPVVTLIDTLIAEQQSLTAAQAFSRFHETKAPGPGTRYRGLMPLSRPLPGEQYAFEVDLDRCSGCKSCVTACHALNGLDDTETWRSVGLLVSPATPADAPAIQQHVTSACHHCVDPACLNGCPVLAYDKDPQTGIVRHLDDQCIGCSYCVMKCPYEVPKYSRRLGIVRKCDLCSNRLVVGEAPACVQACPHEAIRITLGRTADPPPLHGEFLPDSPDPSITRPTTRYRSRKGLSKRLQAADHDELRLDHPHWPLAIMLVLTQSAAGMFLAGGWLALLRPELSLRALVLGAAGTLLAGLAASVVHLGQPLKAWRVFLGWRASWLSREILAFQGFAATAGLAVATQFIPGLTGKPGRSLWLALAAAAGIIGVLASAMVYVDTKRPLWRARITLGNFIGTMLLMGATLTAFIGAWSGMPLGLVQVSSFAALAIRTSLFLWRRGEVRRALGDPASPIHLNARIITHRLGWTLRTRTALFAASTVFGLMALVQLGSAAPWWTLCALATTLASESIGRHVFFVAGTGKRMPGGVLS